jgi:hypothetical protein
MPMAVPGQQTANALAGICQSPRQVVGLNPATRIRHDPQGPLSATTGSVREPAPSLEGRHEKTRSAGAKAGVGSRSTSSL